MRRVLLVVLALLAGCPEEHGQAPSITALDRTTHEPKLPIATGAHAAADCNDCHGAFDTFTEFDCLGCHTREKTDPTHSGNPDYAFENAACLTCHPKGTAESGPHLRFPIGTGTRHVERSCSKCHPGPTKQEFTCLTCHAKPATDGAHGTMPEYAWESPRCYACHPAGTAPEHTQFPIGTGTTHPERTCNKCHTGATMADFTCLTCHLRPATDPVHATVGGYGYESPKCYACHPTGVATVDHAPFFPIASGSKHAPVGCADCHPVPLDRTQLSCNACHSHPAATMDGRHTTVGGYGSASPLCARCHADSQITRVSAHLPFRITSGTKHYRTSCFACHPGMRTDKPWATDFARARIDCLACHSRAKMDDQHQEEPGYQYQSTTCITGGCHADGSKPD